MVRVARKAVDVDEDPDKVLSFVSNPHLFIPLWPFTVSFSIESGRPRVTLLLKRFGFKMRVDYDVDVSVDRSSRVVVYKCSTEDKLFILTVRVNPISNGSRIVLEASYSGPYERFSPPLLEEFLESLVAKLKPAIKTHAASARRAEAAVEATGKLLDPRFIVKAITKGRVVLTKLIAFKSADDVANLLKELSEASHGKQVLARLVKRDEEKYIRLLFNNGELIDMVIEERGEVKTGAKLAEQLLDTLRGEWIVTIIELPKELVG